MFRRILVGLTVGGLALAPGLAGAGILRWERKLDSDVRFKVIHDSGLIVAGTSTKAYGLNPETGEQKWMIDGLMKNYDPEMVKPQPGSEYLVYVYKKGIMDVWPSVRCLNILTGQQVWEWDTAAGSMPADISAQIAKLLGRQAPTAEEGAFLIPAGYPTPITSVVVDEARDQFLLGCNAVLVGVGKKFMNPLLKREVINAKPKSFDQGALIAVERKTGRIKWLAVAPDQTGKVKTKLTYLWSVPQIVGDQVAMDGAGLHVFNLSDGSLVSAAPFNRENGQGANASTVVDNGVAYVTSAGQLTAVDMSTGQVKWQTKPDKDAVYTEVYVAGDKVVLKRGGTFADAKGKPKVYAYGLDVLDKNTGQPAFDSEKMHKPKDRQIADMTNLLVDGRTVYYATQRSLRAFDLTKLDYRYSVPLGEDQGDFDGLKSINGGDGKLYVLMKQSTKAFNPADGSLLWSKTFEPPKVSGLALAMLNTLSAMEAQQRANNSISGRAKYRVYSGADFYQARAAASDQYNYVMAKENGKPTVVGVNLGTGKDDRRAVMDKKEADYVVDERWGLLLNVEKKETVQVYDMNQ